MAQVIIPVTMTVLQKKLYKSILAKNPELIQAIFGNGKGITRVKERGNLNNILGQLRKCLCHPFVYSEAIEERGLDPSISHRTMVDASQKLQLLEIMLPKLHERGHRVLFFSQYLGQLTIMEDFLNGLGLECTRLDGGVSTINKQKRIDAFNAPNSTLFAFLLSTRSGGVGINLATADTVIIMDPDFNPQVDIQAISRAHRLGQKKKVLVFQLMTKDSAEERIIQIGRKKMALDHLLIQKMETELEPTENDTINALKFSAKALFEDDDGDDIHYDSASVDKLLDRSQVENTNTGTDESTESSFSFARIWANDKGALTEDVGDPDSEETIPNPSVWEAILKQREADAAEEAAKRQQTFGRGKRQRTVSQYLFKIQITTLIYFQAVDYQATNADFDEAVGEQTPKGRKRRGPPLGDDDDGDFASAAGSDRDDETDPGEQIDLTEIVPGAKLAGKSLGTHSPTPGKPKKGKAANPLKTPQRLFTPKSRGQTASFPANIKMKTAKAVAENVATSAVAAKSGKENVAKPRKSTIKSSTGHVQTFPSTLASKIPSKLLVQNQSSPLSQSTISNALKSNPSPTATSLPTGIQITLAIIHLQDPMSWSVTATHANKSM